MDRAVVTARVLFVMLATFIGVIIWFADNGVPNVLLSWVRGIRHGDKYAHFVLYGGLAFLLHIGLRGRCWRAWKLAVPVAAVVVLGLGLGEEISQLFSPRRKFELFDLACNLGGVTLFTLLAQGVLYGLQRSSTSQRA